MPAPIAKGLIIFTSVLVAAGIALYQDPVVKAWVDRSRRKIAIALHSLGDDIDPPSPDSRRRSYDDAHDEAAARRRRRDDIVRRNRNELIRKAREEGVAVDLDELASIGRENEAEAMARARKRREENDRSDRSKSFDELVGSDGTLRATTTSTKPSNVTDTELRHRGAAARGMTNGSVFANPFEDESVLFDRDVLENADKPKDEFKSRESSRTLESSSPTPEQPRLVDVGAQLTPEMAEVNDTAVPTSVSASFHSALSSPSTVSHHSFIPDDHDAPTPTGMLTPTEEGFSTAASMIGSNADDIGNIDLLSDAEMSDFSHVSRSHTPSSWTDVGSDEGSEDGEHQHH